MTIRSVARWAVPEAVPTQHNAQTRSVRHAVRDQWGSFADPAASISEAFPQSGVAASVARSAYHRTFAEVAESMVVA